MTTSPRRWRLLAFDEDKEVIHDQVYIGDESLDIAVKGVERDPRTHKIRVEQPR